MAMDDPSPVQAPSSSPMTERRHLVQVATNNSSTFIQFPTNSRPLLLVTPRSRSRTNFLSCTPDIQSRSGKSKSSNAPSSSIASADRPSQKLNPILNNSLLNHRKEQPKCLPTKISTDISHTTRLCLSSKPLTIKSHDQQIPIARSHTAPVVAHPTESHISDQQVLSTENEINDEQEVPPLDPNKYDYITRWLEEVEQARSTKEISSKTKRQKTKSIKT